MAKRSYYDLKKAADGQYYFRLVAANGQVVSVSEMYPTRKNAVRGIDAVRRAATTERIKEDSSDE